MHGATKGLDGVLYAVARTAARLCEAKDCRIYLTEGDRLRLAVQHGALEVGHGGVGPGETRPISRRTALGLAIVERRTVHVRDMVAAARRFPDSPAARGVAGVGTLLVAPLFREGTAIGGIVIRRTVVRPFSRQQIRLLQAFADQAALAIDNARLSDELERRNGALAQALERETATADILRVISSSPTELQPVLDAVAERAARVCGARDAVIRRLEGGVLRRVAHHGPIPSPPDVLVPVVRESVAGRAVLERRTIQVADMQAATDEFPVGSGVAREQGFHTILTVPLLRGGAAIGVINVRRSEAQPFTDAQIALLQTFADQAVIAIENVRLFTELGARNRDVTEALERQTATSDILRTISRSPTELAPVLTAMAESAARLCGARDVIVLLREGERLVSHAHFGAIPLDREVPLVRDSLAGRAVLDRRPIHIEDLSASDDIPIAREFALRQGFRTGLAVPLLRQDAAIGVILVRRAEARCFTESQVLLLQTFADQAVIAIENVRLFTELQRRTEELSRSVDQLRALGDVSQALGSTLDLEAVLSTIVQRAGQLAGTDGCTVFEYDESAEQFRLRATYGLGRRLTSAVRTEPIRKGEGAVGRLALSLAPIQIPDIAAEGAYQGRLRASLLEAGQRAMLAIPLLREDRLLGGFTVSVKTPGTFPQETVALLQTFAAQSALAIHNARLFREIADKSRQLEEASRHKSQFLASMSHELRTPLNAILGYTELIADNIYGEVPERMREVLERVDKSGRHLLGLINDVLDLSKIEAGQLALALTDYLLSDVVQSVGASVGSLVAEKKLELAITVDPDLPVGRGDPRRLTQVLLNLVGNAIKFTEAGRVAVDARQDGDAFRVSVTDTGPGIAPEDQARIFEEFQQVRSASAGTRGGTGLGLAIARRIVQMHGGRLWVESAVGQGSTFSFTIPVRVEVRAGATGA